MSIIESFNAGSGISNFNTLLALWIFATIAILFLVITAFTIRSELAQKQADERFKRLVKIIVAIAIILAFLSLLTF